MTEYPGPYRLLGALLGIKASSAKRYMQPTRGFPAKHAARLAEHLEARAAECEALARELREYAGDRRLLVRRKPSAAVAGERVVLPLPQGLWR